MHSKWKIWDFIKSRPTVLAGDAKIIAFYGFDPLVFKLIKDNIDYKIFEEKRLNVLLGKEITNDWFDDNFKSLGLFGNSDSYLIHFAEELSEDIQKLLLSNEEIILDNRYVILNFSKDDKFYKKLQKSKSLAIETIHIQAPAFWEENELLNFLCGSLKVYLTVAAKEKIKEKIPFNINSYYQLLSQVKINFEEKTNIDVDDISPLFSELKVDQFELAELFGSKKLKLFYKKLVESTTNGHDIVGILYFLQSHIIKMYDLSYLDSKPKLTKYDKQLMAQSKLWDNNSLARALKYVGELLILAKKKDRFLENKIKRDFLKTMNF